MSEPQITNILVCTSIHAMPEPLLRNTLSNNVWQNIILNWLVATKTGKHLWKSTKHFHPASEYLKVITSQPQSSLDYTGI